MLIKAIVQAIGNAAPPDHQKLAVAGTFSNQISVDFHQFHAAAASYFEGHPGPVMLDFLTYVENKRQTYQWPP